jgi:hypothetical protein
LLQITHAARPQLIVETGPTPYIAKIRSALMKVVSFLAAAVVLAGIAGAQTPPLKTHLPREESAGVYAIQRAFRHCKPKCRGCQSGLDAVHLGVVPQTGV